MFDPFLNSELEREGAVSTTPTVGRSDTGEGVFYR